MEDKTIIKQSLHKGWAHVVGSKKAHYFNNSDVALCRTIGNYGAYVFKDYDHDNSENCAACKKKRATLNNT